MIDVQTLKLVVPSALWPYLGTVRRWVRTVSPGSRRAKQQLLADSSLSEDERALLNNVSSRIYYNDGMYHGDGLHYFKVGLSAISCINGALESAGLKNL